MSDFIESHSWIARELEYPGDLRRGSAGKGVRRLQEHLNLKGYRIGVDGDFGPATEKALHRFQSSSLAGASGRLDERTWDNLTDDIHRALEPVSGPSLEHAAVLLANRYSRINPHELGQNQGPWVRLFMRGNEGPAWPWCMGWVSFVFMQAAYYTGHDLDLKYTYSCDILAEQGEELGRFRSGRDFMGSASTPPPPGSIFLVRRTDWDWVHTGIVIESDTQTVRTVEGNTNDEGHRDGYEVCERIRSYRNLDFILPA